MKSKDIAMIMAGVAAGMVGSRIIPPLVAALIGSQRVRAGGEPFSLLIDDHRKIRNLLDQMLAEPGSAPKRVRLFLMLKRKLAKHAMAEEDVVYPIVRNDSAEGDERKHLYDEHADMKILLHEIEEDVKSRQDWTINVTALRNLILNHIEHEEKTIFPELRRELTQARQPRVAGQISREEALVV